MSDQSTTLPASLAALNAAMEGRKVTVNTQPVRRVLVNPTDLPEFVAALEAFCAKHELGTLTPKPDFVQQAGKSPDGQTNLCLYAAYVGIPGNNVAVYYKGKGSLAGALAEFQWPLPPDEMSDKDREPAKGGRKPRSK